MAYCTWHDVQEKMQQITITDTSKPTEDDITKFSEEITEEMDSILGASGINLPVTDTGKLKILRSIAVNGVKAEALKAVSKNLDESMALRKLYDSALKRIIDNPDIINSTESIAQGPGYGQSSNTVERFERGLKQW